MNDKIKGNWRPLLLVLVFAAAPLLALLIAGDFPVFTRGEGREGLVVRAILDGDSIVLPLRNGFDIPSKPPLYHWCAALVTKLGAFSPELALRLPSALFALLTGLFYFTFLRQRFGELFALSTTAITLCSFEWLRTAQSARVDMTFYTALILALLCLYRLFEDDALRLRMSLIAGIAMGLAILAKGPAGLVIPLAVAGIYSLLSFARFRRSFAFLAISAVIAAAIGIVWYLAAFKVGGERFLEVQLLKENLARLSNQGDYELGHESGPLSILGLLLVGTLPFSLLLIPLLRYGWSLRKVLFKNPDPFSVFCLIWLVVFLLVFGVSASKRGVYLVGCFPAFAYLLNRSITRIGEVSEAAQTAFRRTIIWTFALCAIILTKAWLFALFGKGLILAQIKKEGPAELVSSLLHNNSLLAAVGVLVLLLWFFTFDQSRRSFNGGLWAVSGLATVVSIFIGIFILPEVARQQSPQKFMANVAPVLAQSRLNFQEDYFFAANYYSNRQLLPTSRYSELEQGEAALVIRSNSSAISLPDDMEAVEIVSKSSNFDIQGKDHLILLRVKKENR